MRKFLLAITLLFGLQSAKAQLTVTPITNDTALINYLQGYGLTITNMNVTAAPGSIAFYAGSSPMAFGSGIMMSTGVVADSTINQPASEFLSTDNMLSGDVDLATLIGETASNMHDACIIEFDCVPTYSNLTFDFSFGSEEYNEFVGSINDAFAIFFSGLDTSGNNFVNRNLAVLPGTTIPVSINNLNNGTNSPSNGPCTNCQYFIDNNLGQQIALDGFSTSLQGNAEVIPGQTYHFKIVIADAADGIYDSQVMFLTNSFRSIAPIGIMELHSKENISLYPNPAKDKFTIAAPGVSIDKTEMYTIDGRLVLKQGKGNNINTENLSKGIYIVHIYSGSEKVTKKLIIE